MKVVILVENGAPEGLEAEAGLSLYVENEGRRYLIDAGCSDKFLHNAQKLGVSLADVDAAFLSHGHHDHAGGIELFLRENDHARLFMQHGANERYYAGRGFKRRYIGAPKGILGRHASRITVVDGLKEVESGVWLVPCHKAGLEARGARARLYHARGLCVKPDDFRHENAIVFDTPRGLVAFSCCSHAGVENILDEISARFAGRPILAVIGGFHLMGPAGDKTCAFSEAELAALAERLEQTGVSEIWTGHCTGVPARDTLKRLLPEKIRFLQTGAVIEL